MNKLHARAPEEGHIAACLLLVFTLSLELTHYLVSRSVLKQWEASYQSLNQKSQDLDQELPGNFEAWGQEWPELPPRIDFGAFTKREGEAEALCFYLRSAPPENGGRTYLCN